MSISPLLMRTIVQQYCMKASDFASISVVSFL